MRRRTVLGSSRRAEPDEEQRRTAEESKRAAFGGATSERAADRAEAGVRKTLIVLARCPSCERDEVDVRRHFRNRRGKVCRVRG